VTRQTAAGLIALPLTFAIVVIGCNKDSRSQYRATVIDSGTERIRQIESRVAKLEARPPTILVNRPPRPFEPLPGVRR
jgi:hypothetical protein